MKRIENSLPHEKVQRKQIFRLSFSGSPNLPDDMSGFMTYCLYADYKGGYSQKAEY